MSAVVELAGGGAETRAKTRAEADEETRAVVDETRAVTDEVTWRANPSSKVSKVPLVRQG